MSMNMSSEKKKRLLIMHIYCIF